MAQYRAFDLNVEVRGDVVCAFVDVMGAFRSLALKILAQNGIADPQPESWYQQQAWLDAFHALSHDVGPNTLHAVGRYIPDHAPYPSEPRTFEQILDGLDGAFKSCHRNGDPGSYHFVLTGPQAGTMRCQNPYPCDFDRGIVQALAERFQPEGSIVDVFHEPGGTCKKDGAEYCNYLIRW